jgi:phage gpG-like protein
MGTPAEAAAMLTAIADRLSNLQPIMEVVAADVRTFIDDRFASGTNVDGQPWAGLSDVALEMRARKARGYTTNRMIGPLPEGQRRRTAKRWTRAVSERVSAAVFGAKPLLDTTRLRRSITARANPKGLKFGSNVIYAAKQNFGDAENKMFNKAPAPVPARSFLPVTASGLDLAPLAFWDRQREVIAHWVKTGEVLP